MGDNVTLFNTYGQVIDNMTVKHITKKILHPDSLTVTRINSISNNKNLYVRNMTQILLSNYKNKNIVKYES